MKGGRTVLSTYCIARFELIFGTRSEVVPIIGIYAKLEVWEVGIHVVEDILIDT
jgi:hypothetical protein